MKYLGNNSVNRALIKNRYYIEKEIISTCGGSIKIYEIGDTQREKHIAKIDIHLRAYHFIILDWHYKMYIKSLWVKEDYRNQGLATFLIMEAIKYAERNCITSITIKPMSPLGEYLHGGLKQEDLEQFYKSFRFGLMNNREIEFV